MMTRFFKRKEGAGKRSPKPKTRGTFSRRMIGVSLCLLLAPGAWLGGALAWAQLWEHVDRQVLAERPGAVLQFVDLPEPLLTFAAGELQASLSDLRRRPWTDPPLCEEMGKRLAASPWISSLQSVRRTGNGRFEIRAVYRVPVAAVQIATDFYLVDADGFRLPGVYATTFSKVVRGVQAPPPPPASPWAGEDLRAALKLLRLLSAEPYAAQIAGVDVDNFEGRSDPRGSHIELITDRTGGRIRWGSAPGRELEENTIAQKIGLLRKNYATTGRGDAGHLVIDISTFPDRYTVPTELGLRISPDPALAGHLLSATKYYLSATESLGRMNKDG